MIHGLCQISVEVRFMWNANNTEKNQTPLSWGRIVFTITSMFWNWSRSVWCTPPAIVQRDTIETKSNPWEWVKRNLQIMTWRSIEMHNVLKCQHEVRFLLLPWRLMPSNCPFSAFSPMYLLSVRLGLEVLFLERKKGAGIQVLIWGGLYLKFSFYYQCILNYQNSGYMK